MVAEADYLREEVAGSRQEELEGSLLQKEVKGSLQQEEAHSPDKLDRSGR